MDHETEGTTSRDLDAVAIVRALEGNRIGRSVHVHATLSSTMDEAAALAAAGAADGTVVIADHQSAGRGRLDRVWMAPPVTSLLLSILFRPELPPDLWTQLPMAVGLAAVEAVEALLPAKSAPALKWPNDLLAGDAKLGGLLAEAADEPSGRGFVVVGLGINVNQRAHELPRGAISLAQCRGARVDRMQLAVALLRAADAHYGEVLLGQSLVPRWSARLATLGRRVTATGPAGMVRGRAVAVDDSGALVVETDAATGARVVVRAGDVTLDAQDA